MWAPVSLSVSSETLKHKTKFCYTLTDNSKRPYFIHRFCDEDSTASAKAMASVIQDLIKVSRERKIMNFFIEL
jgi:hypothetical protein